LLAPIQNKKTTAVAISITHAACEHPHQISAIPGDRHQSDGRRRVSETRLRELRLNRGNGFVRTCKLGEWNG
jgi:hypothetical protein